MELLLKVGGCTCGGVAPCDRYHEGDIIDAWDDDRILRCWVEMIARGTHGVASIAIEARVQQAWRDLTGYFTVRKNGKTIEGCRKRKLPMDDVRNVWNEIVLSGCMAGAPRCLCGCGRGVHEAAPFGRLDRTEHFPIALKDCALSGDELKKDIGTDDTEGIRQVARRRRYHVPFAMLNPHKVVAARNPANRVHPDHLNAYRASAVLARKDA